MGRSFVGAAKSAVIRAGGTPVDMAYFSADPRPSAQVCREVIRSDDVFVGGVEFQEASITGIPRLVFLLGDDAQGPAELFRDVELWRASGSVSELAV